MSASAFSTKSLLPALALAVALEAVLFFSGAPRSDLGADPDEPAHAVTALMVRDYLAEAAGSPPLAFASRYYENFPKVALGHYPPGYYAAAALPLLPGADPDVLLSMQVVLLVLLAFCIASFARSWLGASAAWAAALLVVALPPMLKLTVLVMADILLALLCVLAAAAWARYLRTGAARASLAFGFLAAAAILTKGSGLMLAALPAGTLVLKGRWGLLKKASWWLAAAPVVVFAAPWMLYSSRITQEGMLREPVAQFFLRALGEYARMLPWSLGWVLMALLALALAGAVWQAARARRLEMMEALLWSWLAGGVALMLLIPAGFSSRYLVPLLAPVVLLSISAVTRLAMPGSAARSRLALPWLVLALTLGMVGVLPKKDVAGYASAARKMLAEAVPARQERWLVSSDARGEGALIAEACYAMTAQMRVQGRVRILRASKELSTSDWLGRDYRAAFTEAGKLLRHLDDGDITWVVLDGAQAPAHVRPHHALLSAAMASENSGWRLFCEQKISRMDTPGGVLRVYRRVEKLP